MGMPEDKGSKVQARFQGAKSLRVQVPKNTILTKTCVIISITQIPST